MNAEAKTISDILSGPKQFVIPAFQRDYEWKEDRWETLWQDIIAVMDEYQSHLIHFIGPMVSLSTNSVPYDVPKYIIVDGQQRLITIFLLLTALRDRSLDLNLPNLARSITSNSLAYIVSKTGEETPKILPRIRDRDTLYNIFRGNWKEVDPYSLLTKAYHFFRHELEAMTPIQRSLFYDVDPAILLDTLDKTIIHRLRIVLISLDQSDNPSNIYESLNFKSDKLEDGDLIRNYVFMKLGSLENQEQFNVSTWQSFEEMFAVFGVNQAEKLTDFYYKHLISNSTYFARKQLYGNFAKYVDKYLQDNKLPQLVSHLKKYAQYYIDINVACGDSDLETAFKRFRQLDTDTAIPLVMHIYAKVDLPNSKFTKTMFISMLRVIESFILRRSIVRARTRGYGLDFAEAQPRSDSIRELMSYFAEKGWPEDSEIMDALNSFEFYLRESKKCNLVLREIEISYAHREQVILDGLSLEHIMPQNLNLAWRSVLGDNADQIHAKHLHTLGNLTLTGYNSDMSDRPFSEKKQIFSESKLKLNRYFDSIDTWIEQKIVERTKNLAERFITIWERPTTVIQVKAKKQTGGRTKKRPPTPLPLN